MLDLAPLGDSAVLARLGAEIDEATLGRVRALAAEIARAHTPGIVDVVPAYQSVTVVYDPMQFVGSGARPYQTVCQLISWCAERAAAANASATGAAAAPPPEPPPIVIPVCYGGEAGVDLETVAAQCGLTAAAVIELHSGASYRVYAIGFVPGFPYLGGLPAALGLPRRATPRTQVPPGSVGIGSAQTGVYPMATPGGWHLIGRTPLQLFRPAEPRPGLLRVGDAVRFTPISAEEFSTWR